MEKWMLSRRRKAKATEIISLLGETAPQNRTRRRNKNSPRVRRGPLPMSTVSKAAERLRQGNPKRTAATPLTRGRSREEKGTYASGEYAHLAVTAATRIVEGTNPDSLVGPGQGHEFLVNGPGIQETENVAETTAQVHKTMSSISFPRVPQAFKQECCSRLGPGQGRAGVHIIAGLELRPALATICTTLSCRPTPNSTSHAADVFAALIVIYALICVGCSMAPGRGDESTRGETEEKRSPPDHNTSLR